MSFVGSHGGHNKTVGLGRIKFSEPQKHNIDYKVLLVNKQVPLVDKQVLLVGQTNSTGGQTGSTGGQTGSTDGQTGSTGGETGSTCECMSMRHIQSRRHEKEGYKVCVTRLTCVKISLVPRPSITSNMVEGLVKLLHRMTSGGRTEA